jgi:20S proteasome alpha/beta subunit
MEEKISTDNVEVCVIRADTKKLVYKTPEEINAIIDTLAA